jgi:hypothetical protein
MFSLRLARQWLILPLHLAYNSNPRELMNEPTTLGAYLRRERERRGLALRTISETTKVSIGFPLAGRHFPPCFRAVLR